MTHPLKALQDVVATWSVMHPTRPTMQQVAEFVEQSKILDMAEKTNLRTVIFSYHDFSIYHINVGTAKYFGTTPEEVLSEGPAYLVGCIHPHQIFAATENTKFITAELQQAGMPIMKEYHSSYVNCNIICRHGNKHRSLFHAFPVLFDEQGHPMLGMFLIYDLEPFMNDGIWWFRYKLGDKVFVYHADSGKLEAGDILRERELEILRRIAEGATSKEIAQKINLSIHTIENHRRNMLKRTGAVDTSALIHVCKLCGIL
jgi:DNA-binding CsgD family transcriptional regulator